MGRKPSVRGVYPVEDLLIPPDDLLVDTCFVYSALGKLETHYEACREFLARATEHGTTLYFSELLEVELHEVAWKVALKERWNKDWRRKRVDGRARRRAGRLSSGIMRGWNDLLRSFGHIRVEVSEVRDQYPAVMRRWGVASNDAIHVATAMYVDVPNIATHDTGLANVAQKDAQLYAPKACVKKMREFRGGPKV